MSNSLNIKLSGLLLLMVICKFGAAQTMLDSQTLNPSLQEGFVENRGQVATTEGQLKDVLFSMAGHEVEVLIAKQGLKFIFSVDQDSLAGGETAAQPPIEKDTVELVLVNSNPEPKLVKEERCGYTSNFYLSHCNEGILGVPAYKKITLQNVYPDIDWVLHHRGDFIKHEFLAHPGANLQDIQIQYIGAQHLELTEGKGLAVSTLLGRIWETKPISFQGPGDEKLETNFILEGSTISFDIAWNGENPLRIDPELKWATYNGGSGNDVIGDCLIDDQGNIYLISGQVNKFDSTGTIRTKYYFPHDAHTGAFDADYNLFVAGSAHGSNYQYQNAHQSNLAAGWDAFLTKLDTSGSMLWGTYFGGIGGDHARSCTVDKDGNVFLSGNTSSGTSLISGGHQTTYGGGFTDAFLAKFTNSGGFLWSTYYGGAQLDFGHSCTTDTRGNVYLAGTTESSGNIGFRGFDTLFSNSFKRAYLVKFNSTGVRQWATYYGSSSSSGNDCSTDHKGNIYLVGETATDTTIYLNGHQKFCGGYVDGFLVKFDDQGNRIWGSYYGGEGSDELEACDVDFKGNVYVAGMTLSDSAIYYRGYQSQRGGAKDAFIAKFDQKGKRLWSTYHGGLADDKAISCYSYQGTLVMSGETRSGSGISYKGYQPVYGGNEDAFMVKYGSCATLTNTEQVNACDKFTWPVNNKSYYYSLQDSVYLTSNLGCDSLVVLNLTITNPDSTISQDWRYLRSNQTSATYQWLDCANSYALIPGATDSLFLPQTNGIYAVAITKNGCTDTSGCYLVSNVGLPESPDSQWKVFPNPVTNKLYVDPGTSGEDYEVSITDAAGKLVLVQKLSGRGRKELAFDGRTAGLYFVRVSTASGNTAVFKIYKEN